MTSECVSSTNKADKILLQTENLTKSFLTEQGEVQVLRGVNFIVGARQRVAVVGESGSGKTTLMHILGTLDHPTSGSCYFDGVDLFSLSTVQLDRFRNQSLGFVFQFHQLLPEFSALENVMMPALIAGEGRCQAEKQARTLLEETGLEQRLLHKPGQLSGGEQQRVAIARALVLNPKLLIADEPTGNLDSKTSDGIYALLDRLHTQHELTMIVVTHNVELAQRMDKILCIRDGVVESVCR
ncbi:MAG: ABC transporter ATP-binding protein [Desulfobacteraceae bacterium 4572_35.1]|nr:MAG: ABC transporter ATP-binding protein [Desulfobacteraceae bacterium 4572_35.1]